MTQTPQHPQQAAPAPLRVDAVVLSNADEGGGNWRMRLRVDGWPGSRPGQFVMLSPGARTAVERTDPLLPRPMAIYRTFQTSEGSALEVVYKRVGRGTGLLSETPPGQRVRTVGPLGTPFPASDPSTAAILVGGGTGVASLYELAARERLARSESGTPTLVLLGARGAGELMARRDFEVLDVDLRVATEDGSAGHRGLVTEALAQALDEHSAATVFACGPTPMMRRCGEIAAERRARCLVSLENHMACGFGVCLGCAAPIASGGYALVCTRGPVFEASEIAWEGLP